MTEIKIVQEETSKAQPERTVYRIGREVDEPHPAGPIQIRVIKESGESISLEEDNAAKRIALRSHEEVIEEEVQRRVSIAIERYVESEIERRVAQIQERLEEKFEEEVERRAALLAERKQ